MNIWENTLEWLRDKKLYKDDLKEDEVLERLWECYEKTENPIIFPCLLKKEKDKIIYTFKQTKKNSLFYFDEDIDEYGLNEDELIKLLEKTDIVYAGNENNNWKDKLSNYKHIIDEIEPAEPDAQNIPNDLLKNQNIYIYNGQIKLKIRNEEFVSNENELAIDNKNDNKLYKDVKTFENKNNQKVWEYILNSYFNKFTPTNLDDSFEAEILKEYFQKVHNKKIFIFKGDIRLKYNGNEYSLGKGYNKIEIEKNNAILFKDINEVIKNDAKLQRISDWVDFAIRNNILNANVILKALENNKINDLLEKRTEVVKVLRERTKELSQNTPSPDLTVEWLIYMTLWEYFKTYVEPRSISIIESEIFYESPEKIAIPITPRAGVEFWEIEGLDIFIHGPSKIYSKKGGIENIGFDNQYGLKIKLDPQGWQGGDIGDKISINGRQYDLEIDKSGKIKVKNNNLTGKGYINGIEVDVKNGILNVKEPIKLKLYVKLEYKIFTQFKDIVVYFLRELIKEKDKKVSEIIPEDIQFIWGPPATGKTTYIACEILENLNQKRRVLILTPTNKAADVVVERVLGLNLNALIYRFPYQLGNKIPTQNIKTHNDTFPNDSFALSTTIHRFIYDQININGYKNAIKDFAWNVIFIDEASMVELPFIIYVLKYAKERNENVKFVISGDPNQLSPIGETPGESDVKGYSTENIYTIMDLGNNLLQNLTNQQQVKRCSKTFYTYDLTQNSKKIGEILIRQYRSVQTIGNLYSQFMYNGTLQHDRQGNPGTITVNLYGQSIPLQPITIIYFDVDKNNPIKNIYKGSSGSSYHIPSAIFAVELAKEIEKQNKSIGIISPYKIQVDIMHKLAKALNLTNTTVSTVHGFQGDERDVIIFVLNPPSIKPSSYSHFDNEKLLNVAISRAKDYLVILWPIGINSKNTQNLYNLINNLINLRTIQSIPNDIENGIEIYQHQEVNLYETSLVLSKKYSFFISPKGPVDIVVSTPVEYLL